MGWRKRENKVSINGYVLEAKEIKQRYQVE
jgi:hypothetical protein